MASSDWFWRLTHPRETNKRKAEAYAQEVLQERAEVEERIEQARARIEQERSKWLAVAHDPEATSGELRQVLLESYSWEKDEAFTFTRRHLDSEIPERIQLTVWDDELLVSLYSHPNLPLELFGDELQIQAGSVAGLLKNPVCPLLFLERPDFIASLSSKSQRLLCHYALQREDIPPFFLEALTDICDPWMALEAKTHISGMTQEGSQTPPDLGWLESQIFILLRQETFRVRRLLYELEWYGLIPQGTVEDPLQEGNDIASPTLMASVEDWVQQARDATKRGRKAQRAWIARWFETVDWMSDDIIFVSSAIVSHPAVPKWVLREIRNSRLRCFRLPLSQHLDTPSRCVAEYSQEVCMWNITRGGWMRINEEDFGENRVLGTFYLLLRRMSQPIEKVGEDKTRHWITIRDYSYPLDHLHFLARLAIALHLDEADPNHRSLRTKLLDDTNHYVRAAARKEISWPSDRTVIGEES